MRIIGEIVETIDENTIMNYKPQSVIVDYVKNFWLKNWTTDVLKSGEVFAVESAAKASFMNIYPDADKETLDNFASDTVFHLAFKLSKQGRWIDNVARETK